MTQPSIAVLSIGDMGFAFAKTFVAKTVPVTVWNRTRNKAELLAEHGVHIADTVAEAIERSDIIFALPKPYAAVGEYLCIDDIGKRLTGKHLVVMSSAQSLDEPMRMATWAQEHSIHFVDGKIFAYPREIGIETTPLVYCGNEAAFRHIEPILTALGLATYLGETITHSAVLEASVISFYPAVCAAFFNGIAMCKAMNFPLEIYMQSCFAVMPGMQDYLQTAVDKMIPTGNFDPKAFDTAPIATWAQIEHFQEIFREAGVAPLLLELVLPFMKKQIERGNGHLDLSSICALFTEGV